METNDVRTYIFEPGQCPLVIEAKNTDMQLSEWIVEHQSEIESYFAIHRALLFRNFGLSEEGFPKIVTLLCHEPLEYLYQSTPRTRVSETVYTATEYPSHHAIPFHNENAYQRDWPMRLLFCCFQPAEQGGETPIADTHRVTKRISQRIVDLFAEKQVRYVRNYGSGLDLSWQTVFQTKSKAVAEAYCSKQGIEFEWKRNGDLSTAQTCQALAKHPRTGQLVWFNQAHLFHISSLDEKTQRALLSVYEERNLPRNAYYGDGSRLDPEILADIRDAYRAEAIQFSWKLRDVMLLDNMLVSHARNPFKGKRRILAGMGESYSGLRTQTL